MKQLQVLGLLPSMSGMSRDSYHGCIEDTKCVHIYVSDEERGGHFLVMCAWYVPEDTGDGGDGGLQEEAEFEVTQILRLEMTAKYFCQFELTEEKPEDAEWVDAILEDLNFAEMISDFESKDSPAD